MDNLLKQVQNLLSRNDYRPSTPEQMLRRLRGSPDKLNELSRILQDQERLGNIRRGKGNCYFKNERVPAKRKTHGDGLVSGRIHVNRAGKGFFRPDDPEQPKMMIPARVTGTAMNEDRVLVRQDHKAARQHDEDATGSVVSVLERRRTRLVGTLQRGKHSLVVIPDDPRLPGRVLTPEPSDIGRRALNGDKVVVELAEWDDTRSDPEGEIIEVLGAPGEEGVDMLSVIRQYDLPLHFPRAVLQEAKIHTSAPGEKDIAGRLDCRLHKVVTIDPEDAKDFDDAICLVREARGLWRLWVHIADVSHYVRSGTLLDREARKRGNSTYLVDRVIPMLPEALSNELCSLKPGVDRLTKCVEFELTDDGNVRKAQFHSAVIHSQRRFSYPEALEILQRKAARDPIERMLHDAHRLAQKLRAKRFAAGSLDLDFPESKIRLDDEGKVLRIERTYNDISHQLIEEFMLLANEAVATHLMETRKPALYRVHEEPEADRLEEFREDVQSHLVPCGNLRNRDEVGRLLERLNTLPIGPALKIGFLRSLMRARYAVKPLGHYGLAKAKYTHFTSPIRRYADLVVHRALFGKTGLSASALHEAADHISATERNSADAERDSKDVKLFAYLNAQLASGHPNEYEALVTEVRNFGCFVDVPGLAMGGLVPLSSMADDYYIFEQRQTRLIGRRTRQSIGLGDKLIVQVGRVDTFKKQVDFKLLRLAPAARSIRSHVQRGVGVVPAVQRQLGGGAKGQAVPRPVRNRNGGLHGTPNAQRPQGSGSKRYLGKRLKQRNTGAPSR